MDRCVFLLFSIGMTVSRLSFLYSDFRGWNWGQFRRRKECEQKLNESTRFDFYQIHVDFFFSCYFLVVSRGMCEVIFAFLATTVVTAKECLFWSRDILMCSQVILGKSCLECMRDRFEFHEILVHRCDLLRNRGNIFCISVTYVYIYMLVESIYYS